MTKNTYSIAFSCTSVNKNTNPNLIPRFLFPAKINDTNGETWKNPQNLKKLSSINKNIGWKEKQMTK